MEMEMEMDETQRDKIVQGPIRDSSPDLDMTIEI